MIQRNFCPIAVLHPLSRGAVFPEECSSRTLSACSVDGSFGLTALCFGLSFVSSGSGRIGSEIVSAGANFASVCSRLFHGNSSLMTFGIRFWVWRSTRLLPASAERPFSATSIVRSRVARPTSSDQKSRVWIRDGSPLFDETVNRSPQQPPECQGKTASNHPLVL